MAPAPISWPPSQYWDGDDGSWSSFAIRVGDPGQPVRVLPSTAGQATWVVSPLGCPPGQNGTSDSSTCAQSRGALFDPTSSSSWDSLGNYSVGLEVNLGYNGAAPYGLDTVALGFSDSIGGPAIKSQVVSAMATSEFYVGIFGLGHQGTNISNFIEPHPSFLSALKNQTLIPSLSWAYTAGAPYRSKGVFGSLTFGGYDSSRFVQNNVSFTMASDISRDLVVGLQSITSTTTDQTITKTEPLLPSPILTFIDSTLPFIYLPVEACQKFESTLGLSWDEGAEMYWVNDTLHQALLSSELNFTFTLGDTTTISSPTVQIVLPYASFDLEVKPPFQPTTRKYFPLQQAVNESQYTLGRSFLQEAYIITDYEHSNFSISQCRFGEDMSPDLIAIASTELGRAVSHKRRNSIIGATVSAIVVLLIVVVTVYLTVRRRRRRRVVHREDNDTPESSTSSRKPALTISATPREIHQNSMVGPVRELPDGEKPELLDDHSPSGSAIKISEMTEALAPIAYELRTHRSSQAMIRNHSADACKIFKSTRISKISWTSVTCSDCTPRVDTVISALARNKEFDVEVSSVVTSSIEADIYSSYIRKSLNLDRSLPPTPISETPQVSPLVVRFDKAHSVSNRPRIVQVSEKGSMSAFVSPEYPFSKTFAAISLETVVPPGHSDPGAPRDRSRRVQEKRQGWL